MSLTLPLLLVRVNSEDETTYFSLCESSAEPLRAAEKAQQLSAEQGQKE